MRGTTLFQCTRVHCNSVFDNADIFCGRIYGENTFSRNSSRRGTLCPFLTQFSAHDRDSLSDGYKEHFLSMLFILFNFDAIIFLRLLSRHVFLGFLRKNRLLLIPLIFTRRIPQMQISRRHNHAPTWCARQKTQL